MRADDINDRIPCPVCDGDGIDPIGEWSGSGFVEDPCRFCGGEGEASRHGIEHDAATPADHTHYTGDEVHLNAEVDSDTGGLIVISLPRSDPEAAGFEERYGGREGSVSADAPDALADRILNRPVGSNAPYESLEKSDFTNSEWPVDCTHCSGSNDLCPQCAIDFERGREKDAMADRLEKIARENDLV